MYTNGNLNVDIFLNPYDSSPAQSAESSGSLTYDDLNVYVSNALVQIGIPINIKGYAYFREAILIKVNDPKTIMPVTKVLYPRIAKKFQTSSSRVERAMRHAITVFWGKHNQSYREDHPLYPLLNYSRKPTNSEFITTVVEHITLLKNRA